MLAAALELERGPGESDDAFEAYCARVEARAEWGGQPELLASSRVLGRRVIVHAAGAPVVSMGEGEGGDAAALHLAYHKHYYALGEHYNAAVPI